jgi:hypothetical protein
MEVIDGLLMLTVAITIAGPDYLNVVRRSTLRVRPRTR